MANFEFARTANEQLQGVTKLTPLASVKDQLNIPYDEIKSLVLVHLKGVSSCTYSEICKGVANMAVSRQIVPKPPSEFSVGPGGLYSLGDQDGETEREIVWDLIVARVLTIGMNDAKPNWPWLKVTAYGKKVINSETPVPHDPSGYLGRVREDIPKIDLVIFTYLEESIRTYRSTICSSLIARDN